MHARAGGRVCFHRPVAVAVFELGVVRGLAVMLLLLLLLLLLLEVVVVVVVVHVRQVDGRVRVGGGCGGGGGHAIEAEAAAVHKVESRAGQRVARVGVRGGDELGQLVAPQRPARQRQRPGPEVQQLTRALVL